MLLLFLLLLAHSIYIVWCTSPPLHAPQDVVKAGESQYLEIVRHANNEQSADNGNCWRRSLELFDNLPSDCSLLNENTKNLIALVLTKCHYVVRPAGFPSEDSGCHPEAAAVEICPLPQDDETETGLCERKRSRMILTCKTLMSESAFLAYLQFLNHVDNICFYMQSSLWQQRTEHTIHQLSSTANAVVNQLNEANEAILQSQKISLGQANELSAALSHAHTRMEDAFGEMKTEVQAGREKIQSFFNEIFPLFHRILHFQRVLAAQINDFGTLFLYTFLIILTFYLTASERTRSARANLYILWTIMLLGEVLLHRGLQELRLHVHDWIVDIEADFEDSRGQPLKSKAQRLIAWMASSLMWYCLEGFDDDACRHVISVWRKLCLTIAILHYMITWWRWSDPAERSMRLLGDIQDQLGNLYLAQGSISEMVQQVARRPATNHVERSDAIYNNKYVEEEVSDSSYHPSDEEQSNEGYPTISHTFHGRKMGSRMSMPPNLSYAADVVPPTTNKRRILPRRAKRVNIFSAQTPNEFVHQFQDTLSRTTAMMKEASDFDLSDNESFHPSSSSSTPTSSSSASEEQEEETFLSWRGKSGKILSSQPSTESESAENCPPTELYRRMYNTLGNIQ